MGIPVIAAVLVVGYIVNSGALTGGVKPSFVPPAQHTSNLQKIITQEETRDIAVHCYQDLLNGFFDSRREIMSVQDCDLAIKDIRSACGDNTVLEACIYAEEYVKLRTQDHLVAKHGEY